MNNDPNLWLYDQENLLDHSNHLFLSLQKKIELMFFIHKDDTSLIFYFQENVK